MGRDAEQWGRDKPLSAAARECTDRQGGEISKSGKIIEQEKHSSIIVG